MRPPRRSWQLTVTAHQRLLAAIERLSECMPAVSGSSLVALREAREAVAELAEFVDSSEETEEP